MKKRKITKESNELLFIFSSSDIAFERLGLDLPEPKPKSKPALPNPPPAASATWKSRKIHHLRPPVEVDLRHRKTISEHTDGGRGRTNPQPATKPPTRKEKPTREHGGSIPNAKRRTKENLIQMFMEPTPQATPTPGN